MTWEDNIMNKDFKLKERITTLKGFDKNKIQKYTKEYNCIHQIR
jgi:hypothetical protein